MAPIFYRPTDDCKEKWPDAEHVSWCWWRFMWLKKTRPETFMHGETSFTARHSEQVWMWAYRYIPITRRLYWCDSWMGTNSTLMPTGCVFMLAALLLVLLSCAASAWLFR